MGSQLLFPLNLVQSSKLPQFWKLPVGPLRHRLSRQIKGFPSRMGCNIINCNKATTLDQPNDDRAVVRRWANYGPTIWEHEYIQSITNNHVGEDYEKKVAKLNEEVRMMMLKKIDIPLEKLELIDIVQRLGVSYHFEEEIKSCLDNIYSNTNWSTDAVDLNETALKFRLFREHGYNVSLEVFEKFKDQNGNFKESLCEDTKGLLSLYESSFHALEDEGTTLEEAENFATKHLKENLKKIKNPYLAKLVSHALELPLHWTMQRFEARWFIDAYGMRQDANNALLNFAKIDFNTVQAIHQEDLKHVSRWWDNLGLSKKLPFARDRLVECYLWSLAEVYDPQPQFQYYRRMATRVNQLVTCVDDIYDVYGTLDELELFNDAFIRWDVNHVDGLPDYMKLCFLGNVNSINELGYEALKEVGVHALPYLVKVWTDLCGCYMKEARWFHGGHVPSLEEYLDNGWMSVAIPMMAVHGYFLCGSTSHAITEKGLEAVKNYHDLIKWPSMIVRLTNDLGTSKNELERGDILKSVQIHVHETGLSQEEAQNHIKKLIRAAWRKINTARVAPDCPFGKIYVNITTNLARAGHFMYQHGDAHGHNTTGKNKDRVKLLLLDPISLSFD
ncbi:terpene synthase 10-like [Impatiens glandulifera]|uniref:terpene synthase 10-like n=1 Tax=Impatiens glandulifera TaxID=253017 RepID=UPI001FB1067A|nr:terpene synthase 10-like [Impatiens glandulifera]